MNKKGETSLSHSGWSYPFGGQVNPEASIGYWLLWGMDWVWVIPIGYVHPELVSDIFTLKELKRRHK